jgi:CubicO group peptidase (beta-lactamase class C family)
MEHAYMDPAEDEARGAARGYVSWFGLLRPAPVPLVPGDRPAGGDSFIASAEDMGHYLIAQLNGGRYAGRQVLSPGGIEMLHRGVAPEPGQSGALYAMGWETGTMNGVPVVHHGGDVPHFSAEMVLVPEARWGVIVMMNRLPTLEMNSGDMRIRAIAPGVVSLLHGQQPPTPSQGDGVWLI